MGHGLGRSFRSRRHRKAKTGVDRVIHRRLAPPGAHQADHDQVGAPRLQGGIVHPAARPQIGQKQARIFARRADQTGDNLLALGVAQIHRQRPLALVHSGPEQACPPVRHRPAPRVQPTLQAVKPDHIRPHLRQRHPRQRHGDKSRSLDHPHSLQHAQAPSSSKIQTGSAPYQAISARMHTSPSPFTVASASAPSASPWPCRLRASKWNSGRRPRNL